MPLPMVHLAVASLALEQLQISDLPAYYLGSIAPDGIHMLEGWTPEDKDRSHLGTRTSHDPAAVAEFLGRHRGEYAVGYAMHILTDVCWVNRFLPVFDQRYYSDPHPLQERRPAYYSDTDQMDLALYRTLPERAEIWQHLERARAAELPGILPAEGADLWNRRLLGWFENLGDFEFPVRYLTLEELQAFLQEAADFCTEFLREPRD